MESFEYIDDYFREEKLPEQQSQFEYRLLNDPEFAEQVSFYISMIRVGQNRKETEQKDRFREIYHENRVHLPVNPVKKIFPFVYIMAAAAVVTALVVGFYLYQQPTEPSKLADGYLRKHLQSMSVSMSDNSGNTQAGKELYNNQHYAGALQKFELAILQDTADFEARELAGIAALQANKLDQAIGYFGQLANNDDISVNPGKFYQAIALMKRNRPGDKEQSKVLLEEVIKEGIFGKEDAIEFLRKL